MMSTSALRARGKRVKVVRASSGGELEVAEGFVEMSWINLYTSFHKDICTLIWMGSLLRERVLRGGTPRFELCSGSLGPIAHPQVARVYF